VHGVLHLFQQQRKGLKMADNEAGTVSTALAMSLLLMERPDELTKLQRDGFIKPVSKDTWRLADLVRGFAKAAKENASTTDAATLAQCFALNRTRISQLVGEGWLKPPERKGRYNWFEACSGYIRYLRDENRKTSKSASDSRMRDAKARDIEVRTAQRLGRLVPLEAFEEMIDNIAGMVRSEFAGLATVVTRDLTQRRIIEREVNVRLRRIAEQAMAQAIRIEADGRADDAIRADGAGPVGGSKQNVPADSSRTGTA
jgi:hypothetical protein